MNKLVEARPLSKDVMEVVRLWRLKLPETLRTPFMLTKEMQEDYYKNVICNRLSTTRYWAFYQGDDLIGMGGVENICFENKIGEISVIVAPYERGKGMGKAIVDEILNQGFNRLGLETIFAECYSCGAVGFWDKIAKEKGAYKTVLPRRKYFDGKLWDANYYSFHKEDLTKVE